MLDAPEDILEVMNEGSETIYSTKIIVGPGTGLGAAIIHFNQTEQAFNVVPGEGGHQEFPAIDAQDLRLRKFAFKYYEEVEGQKFTRLSVVQIITGPCIPMLYEFFKSEYPDLEVVVPTAEDESKPDAFKIIESAMRDKDPLCLKVIGRSFAVSSPS